MSDNPVNSQITDSVSSMVTLLSGHSPSQSMGMLDAVLLETLGMAMHNAVARQQQAGTASTAAVTASCARMLRAQTPVPPAPPPTPPSVKPVPGPADLASDIAMRNASATANVSALRFDAGVAQEDAQTAEADLQAIAKLAQSPLPSGEVLK